MAFHPDLIKAVVQAAVNHALQEAAADGQRREDQLRQTIQELVSQVVAIQIAPAQTVAPQIKVYAPIDINRDIVCNEPLDAVKCLPEFAGTHQPSALALAQEVESSYERYNFASSFARSQEDRDKKLFPKAQERQQANPHANPQPGTSKNPYFNKQHKAQVHSALRSDKLQRNNPESMDVDPSQSRMLKPSQAPAYQNRKPAASDRSEPHKKQRVHHVAQSAGDAEKTYTTAACSAAQEINDDAICEYDSDVIYFLGENPCYPSSDEE